MKSINNLIMIISILSAYVGVEGESRYKLSGDSISIPASSTDTERDAAMGNKENIGTFNILLFLYQLHQ